MAPGRITRSRPQALLGITPETLCAAHDAVTKAIGASGQLAVNLHLAQREPQTQVVDRCVDAWGVLLEALASAEHRVEAVGPALNVGGGTVRALWEATHPNYHSAAVQHAKFLESAVASCVDFLAGFAGIRMSAGLALDGVPWENWPDHSPEFKGNWGSVGGDLPLRAGFVELFRHFLDPIYNLTRVGHSLVGPLGSLSAKVDAEYREALARLTSSAPSAKAGGRPKDETTARAKAICRELRKSRLTLKERQDKIKEVLGVTFELDTIKKYSRG